MVSDLVALARGEGQPGALIARVPERFAHDRMPIVVWNVCRHCNMTCPHCYVAAGAKPSPSDLSTSDAKRVLDSLAEAGVRVVIWSGGEPLLRADLFELIAYARDKGLSPQLSSNGSLIDAACAERLAALGVGYVGVSIDGLPEFNDDYRGLPRAFDLALSGLANAHAAGLKTGLRVTVTRRNADHVAPLLELARQRSIDRFYVSHLVYAGRGFRMMGDDLAPSETRALLWQLFDAADRLLREGAALRVVTGGNDSDGPLLLAWITERYGASAAERVQRLLLSRGGNSAGEGVVNIDHRGHVHPDQFWNQATFGDLRTQSFTEVLAHPLRAQLRERTAYLQGRCGRCNFQALCRGSHRERSLAASGEIWGPDPACVMTDAEITAVPGSKRGVA